MHFDFSENLRASLFYENLSNEPFFSQFYLAPVPLMLETFSRSNLSFVFYSFLEGSSVLATPLLMSPIFVFLRDV